MAGKVVVEVPEDPRLSLYVAIRNGKPEVAKSCAFCGVDLGDLNLLRFASEMRSDVAICMLCVKECVNQAPIDVINSLDQWALAEAADRYEKSIASMELPIVERARTEHRVVFNPDPNYDPEVTP